MPVSFSSPARNLFLLGSSGADSVTNFFKQIEKDVSVSDVFVASSIKYSDYDDRYILSGHAQDPNSTDLSFIEKRQEDGTEDWGVTLQGTQNTGVVLRDLEVDSNNDLIVVGNIDDVPFISKYDGNGVLDWQSTSNTGDVKYMGVTSSGSNYYACGDTRVVSNEATAFVEKYDSNGNPLWGKSAAVFGSDIQLNAIHANSRGEVVAGGWLDDGGNIKGYFVKLDQTTGEILWDRTLELTDHILSNPLRRCKIEDVHVDGNDFIYICGFIGRTGSGGETGAGFICKYSPEGNMLWQREDDLLDATLSSKFYQLEVDTSTGQIALLGKIDEFSGNDTGILVKYSDGGQRIFSREIESNHSETPGKRFGKPTQGGGGVALDADSSFYYIFFTDQVHSTINQTPNSYTFGKVSTSGNGLGDFTYDTGSTKPDPDFGAPPGSLVPVTIDYTILGGVYTDRIGKLSDGSVRYDTSDLATNILNPTRIMFDDYATPIANKKRQMDDADSFEYSGSPAVRPADFQELNLLGDVYSGSGDWLDQSGKGNNAVTSFTTTTTLPGTTESENFASVTSSYSTYGTVAENTVTNDLPFTATHYSGKVRDLQTGGFRVDLTGNTTGTDFFMGCWIKFDTYSQSRQMGVDLFGGYVYWETLPNGAIAVRHDGGGRSDSGATSLNDGNWHHIALSRTGGDLYGFLDGTAVISTTSGVSGNSVNTNENFWFFGGSGTAYNVDAKVLDPFVYVGAGTSGYTVPTAPLIDSSGNINHFSGFSGQEEYISPAISISGGTTTTTNSPTYNAAGYWEFDGVDDSIAIDAVLTQGSELSMEAWFNTNTLSSTQYIVDQSVPDGQQSGAMIRVLATGQKLSSFFYYDAGFGLSVDSTAISANTWHHVVVTISASDNALRMYIDGALEDENTSATFSTIRTPPAGSIFAIGSEYDFTGEFFDGEIGEVRVYPRALTPAQVYQNYNATKSKYINEAPDTAPKIGPGIVNDSNLLLNYDFGNRATYDRAENIVPNSQDTTDWNKVRGTIAEVDIVAPDGSSGVFLYTESTETGPHHFKIPYNTAGSDYGDEITWSSQLYFKRYGSKNRIRFGLNTKDDTYRHLLFDFTTGQVESEINISGTYSVDNVGGGWYRINLTDNGDTGSTRPHAVMSCFMIQNDTTTTSSYTGDGESGVYFWGPNLKIGSTSRHIKTHGTAITAPTTVKNLSSTSYTGTINGATFNPAGYFEFNNDGTTMTDWIEVPSFTGFPGGNNSYSHSFWMRTNFTDSNDNPEAVFFYGNESTGQAIRIRVNTSGALTIGHWGGNGYDWSTPGGVVSSNTWHHICETYDGTTNENIIYVDGTQATNSATLNNLSIPTSATLYLGRRITSGTGALSGDYNGDIGGFLVYNRTLTSTEVSQNFNATKSKYGV